MQKQSAPQPIEYIMVKQAISTREQLTLCLEFQSTSDSRKGYKSCALQMVFSSTKLTVKVLPKKLLRTCLFKIYTIYSTML